MGRSLINFLNLEPPFSRVQDRVMFLQRGRRLVVANTEAKMILFLAGRVRAFINDRVVGDVGPGDVLIVPGPCRQSYVPVESQRETRMQVLIIAFSRGLFTCDAATLQAGPATAGEGTTTEFIHRHFGRVQVRAKVLTPAATGFLKALRQEAEKKTPGQRQRAAAWALLLLTEVARQEPGASPEPVEPLERGAWVVDQVKNFLHENLAKALTLEQIAWHVRLSAEHLARTFRAETGRTIFGWLQALRIEQSKVLLAGSHFAVQEVARQSGFSSASLFGRTFKRATGETPLAYRGRLLREAEFSPSAIIDDVTTT